MSYPVGVQTGPDGWDVVTPPNSGWDGFDPAVQDYASKLAAKMLWAASGRRYGLTTLTVRPCRRPRQPGIAPAGWWTPGSGWIPVIADGAWLNVCPCTAPGGRTDCTCGPLQEVRLPGPVHQVVEVVLDGEVLADDQYQVYDFSRLVRVDGEWPDCQDLTAAPGEPGAFAVTYQRGTQIPEEAPMLTGLLAVELAKSVTGGKCRLPRNVASITRAGVEVTMLNPQQLVNLRMFGIPEVDRWVYLENPNGLQRAPVVWSPDMRAARRRTS